MQSGKRSLFSKTRPSRADPFPETSPNNFLQNKLFLISPLRSKRATLYIDPHGAFAVLGLQNPAGAKRPVTFLLSGLLSIPYTYNSYSNSHTTQTTPSPPALPARYATLRSQLLQCTLIFTLALALEYCIT
jgi:hypothetical protein